MIVTDLQYSSVRVPLERYLVPFLRICEWHLKPTHSLNSPLRAKWLVRRGRPQKRAPLQNLTRHKKTGSQQSRRQLAAMHSAFRGLNL